MANAKETWSKVNDYRPPKVILIRERTDDKNAVGTFDYSDLNDYLLIVVGLANPEGDQLQIFDALAKKAREAQPIPLQDVQTLAKKGPLITLSESEDFSKAMEHFASGVHRILVCKNDTKEVVGILSQLKLVKFLWDNVTSFAAIDALYPLILKGLGVGTTQTISINADRTLTDALQLVSNEGLTSVAVVDNALNVIGNISTADMKLLTKSSSLPLLNATCIHFISEILKERGIDDGKDSFLVFHVTSYSTLAHTVAKLVATRSHRMWVVEAASPSPSTPATPLAAPGMTHAVLSSPAVSTPASLNLTTTFPAITAAALPGARISGRLTGIISLTGILNLFARQSDLNSLSPNDERSRIRRSSSSSVRPSFESARNSSIDSRR